MTNDFDITEIESWLAAYVRDVLNVSKNVFSDRPKSLDNSCNDFVVAKVSGGVGDVSAYGECTLAFHLFARDISNRKNGKKLSVMYKRLIAGFPAADGRYILSGVPMTVGDVADNFGFHARIIQIKTILKIS